MTLARTLSSFGVRCLLVERNPTTTRHPKMDITNGRSMELFRRLGVADKLRAVAVPEENNFDISWITSLTGRELHRFRYPSVVEKRAEILARNDGTQPREPAMRVSQVVIEPVLRDAILNDPLIDARWGTAFEDFAAGRAGRHRDAARHGDRRDRDRALRLSRRLRRRLQHGARRARHRAGGPRPGRAPLHGPFPLRRARDPAGLRHRLALPEGHRHDHRAGRQGDLDPADAAAAGKRSRHHRSAQAAGRFRRHELSARDPGRQSLVHASPAGRALPGWPRVPGGRCRAPIHPDRRLRHEHRHRRCRRSRLEAGGDACAASPGRACSTPTRRNAGRSAIAIASPRSATPACASRSPSSTRTNATPTSLGRAIAALGNAENESWGIEFGYRYDGVEGDPVVYQPTTAPGARLPSTFLRDGSALYDRLGPWFTLLRFGDADPSSLIDAAPVPVETVIVDDPAIAPIYEAKLVLVRPDTHVAWRGNACADGRAVWQKVLA